MLLQPPTVRSLLITLAAGASLAIIVLLITLAFIALRAAVSQ